MDTKDIAREVQRRRLALGYRSQAATAQAVGVSETTWSNLESKGQLPGTAASRYAMAKFLGWPVEALEDGYDGPMPPQLTPPGPARLAGREDQDGTPSADERLRRIEEALDHQRQQLDELLDRLAVRNQRGTN